MRVLAVSDDTSMQVVLSLRTSSDLDIVAVSDLDELGPGERVDFDAVLVAMREIGRAMAAIVDARERLGDRPVVLVAASPPAELDPSITPIRTASDLEQIESVIRNAVERWASRDTGSSDGSEHESGGDRERARRSGRRRRSRGLFTARRLGPWRDSGPEPEEEEHEEEEEGAGAEDGPAPSTTSRPDREPQAPELPSTGDLRAALRAAGRLQELADEVPQLASRPAVGHLVVDLVWETFDPDAVVLWALNGGGKFEAISWRGVSPSVLRHKPSSEQPLLADLLEETDSLAYTSEERFPAYLEGLPGLRGNSVIAAALRTEGETHGIVVAAGTGYHRVQANHLRELVADHAYLLAIAAHLELLRRRARIDVAATERGALFT